MKLSELLQEEKYLKADPDKKRVALEKWYDLTIKTNPNYDPATDSRSRSIAFKDVPPTHVQKTPSLLSEMPKAFAQTYLPKDLTTEEMAGAFATGYTTPKPEPLIFDYSKEVVKGLPKAMIQELIAPKLDKPFGVGPGKGSGLEFVRGLSERIDPTHTSF